MTDCIALLTSRPLSDTIENGGTHAWTVSKKRASRCAYAVLCFNANGAYGDPKQPPFTSHGNAYLVGRIADVRPAREAEGRYLVVFDAIAKIDLPDAWVPQRNPFRYTTLEAMGIDPASLAFEPLISEKPTSEPQAPEVSTSGANFC